MTTPQIRPVSRFFTHRREYVTNQIFYPDFFYKEWKRLMSDISGTLDVVMHTRKNHGNKSESCSKTDQFQGFLHLRVTTSKGRPVTLISHSRSEIKWSATSPILEVWWGQEGKSIKTNMHRRDHAEIRPVSRSFTSRRENIIRPTGYPNFFY